MSDRFKDFEIDMGDVLSLSQKEGETVAREYARMAAEDYPNQFVVRHMLFNQIRNAQQVPNWAYLISDRVAQWWTGMRV